MTVAVLLAAAGCSDPKDANKTNFKAALDRHYAAHCVYVTPSVGLSTYPVSIDAATDSSRFDALAAAGLLAASSSAAEHPGPLGIGTIRTETRTFTLTDAGKSEFQPATSGFCAAHYTVSSVDGFSAPTPKDGRTVSEVDVTLAPNLEGWTSNPAVQQRYGAQLSAVQGTHDKVELVLLDRGWSVPGDAPP